MFLASAEPFYINFIQDNHTNEPTATSITSHQPVQVRAAVPDLRWWPLVTEPYFLYLTYAGGLLAAELYALFLVLAGDLRGVRARRPDLALLLKEWHHSLR